MNCIVEGCEEDAVWDGECDEHYAERYSKDETLPVVARVADQIHYMIERHLGDCNELDDDVPVCLEIAINLDKNHLLKEDNDRT